MFRSIFKTSTKFLVSSLSLIFVFASCTDLTESVSDQVTNETFFKKPQDFVSAMGDAYGSLDYVGGTGGFPVIQEIPTDEMITPQRGQDWYDGGNYIRMERHQWKYDLGHINSAWQQLYTGINNSNRLIFQFEQAIESGAADKQQAQIFIDELRALRAYFYYWLLDSFGNVPIVTSFEDAPENPSQPSSNFQEGRRQVFNFVEKELKESLPQLSTDVNETYGRMNRYVVHMTLAKLYLNAEVYIGEPRRDEALEHINAIINSGKFSLASNYSNNFVVNNSGSPEIILAYPYDKVFATGFIIHMGSLHYGMQAKFNMQSQPWNGFSSKQEFYESYIDSADNPGPQGEVWGTQPTETNTGLERVRGTQDQRLGNFLIGPQFTAGGERILDAAAKAELDPNGPPLTITPHINMLEPNACRQCGVRIGKYEIPMGSLNNLSNDFVIYRYADVLLMKAEVLWRQGNNGQALTYINMVRNRAGVHDFNTIDGEKILAERGREMFYSLLRRQDMIRFKGEVGPTDFNDPWRFKPNASEVFRNIFPIPRNQLESNPNLAQNPGYQDS